jgi:hypothetical protein
LHKGKRDAGNLGCGKVPGIGKERIKDDRTDGLILFMYGETSFPLEKSFLHPLPKSGLTDFNLCPLKPLGP